MKEIILGFIQTSFGLAAVLQTEYVAGKLAIELQDIEDGEPIAVLSTNVEGAQLDANQFCVKTWSENEPLIPLARRSGLFYDTRRVSGEVNAPVWGIRPIDPKHALDALEVQNASNLSGVLNSFIKYITENQFTTGFSDPVLVAYASKIGSMMTHGVWPVRVNHLTIENFMRKLQLSLNPPKYDDRPLGKWLMDELSVATHAENPTVLQFTFERLFDSVNWYGKEDRRNSLAQTYISSRANVTGQGEHIDFPYADWQHEAAEGNTGLGYVEWVDNQLGFLVPA